MKKIIILGCFLTLLPAAVSASTFDTTQTGSVRHSLNLQGCYAEQLAVGSSTTAGQNDREYLACNSASGIFVSADYGSTWTGPTQTGADFGAIISVAASDTPGTAFMIGGINLYRTTDNGGNWTQLGKSDNLTNFGQTMAYGHGTLLASYRDGGIVRSSDDGATLKRVTVGVASNNVTGFAYSASDHAWYVLAGTGSSTTLYQSTDGGLTWTATTKSGNYSVIAVHPTTANYLVLSGDTGMEYTSTGANGTWTNMSSDQNHLKSVAINSDDTVIAGQEYTQNNGTTWSRFSSSVLLKGNFFVNDTVNHVWYIQSGRGVATSTDNGATWSDHYAGIQGVAVNDVALTTDKETAWMAVYGGFVKSMNFNSSITAGTDPTWSDFILPTSGIDWTGAVWVNPTDPNIVLATASDMFRSTDAGSAWTKVTTGVDGSVDHFVYDASTSTLYAAYHKTENGYAGGVISSTDNGVTWTNLGMPSAPVNAITLDSTHHVLLAAVGAENDANADHRGLYVYDGSSWLHVGAASGDALYNKLVTAVLYVPASGYTYAAVADIGTGNSAGNGGMYLSNASDVAHTTWTQVTDAGINQDIWGRGLAASPDGKTVYVASARPAGTAYVFKCLADGTNCGTYYTGLVDENMNVLLFDDFMTGGTGLYRYTSTVKFTLKNLTKTPVNHHWTLRVVLQDKITKLALNQQRIKIYKKVHGKFQQVKKAQIFKTKKGQVLINVQSAGSYQVRWTPSSAQYKATYPVTSVSNTVKI